MPTRDPPFGSRCHIGGSPAYFFPFKKLAGMYSVSSPCSGVTPEDATGYIEMCIGPFPQASTVRL